VLETAGLVRRLIELGTVGIGGVVRTGSAHPAIGALDELRAAISAADAILLTRAPTGDHLMRVIADFCLSNAIAPKLMRFETSTALNAHLATCNDNALGFGPETEIRAGNGVNWIGDMPPEIQIALLYVAAIFTHAKAPDAAEAFLKFLDSAAAREKFRRSGVR
jgi:molybdate transport system substrate-binding protein